MSCNLKFRFSIWRAARSHTKEKRNIHGIVRVRLRSYKSSPPLPPSEYNMAILALMAGEFDCRTSWFKASACWLAGKYLDVIEKANTLPTDGTAWSQCAHNVHSRDAWHEWILFSSSGRRFSIAHNEVVHYFDDSKCRPTSRKVLKGNRIATTRPILSFLWCQISTRVCRRLELRHINLTFVVNTKYVSFVANWLFGSRSQKIY